MISKLLTNKYLSILKTKLVIFKHKILSEMKTILTFFLVLVLKLTLHSQMFPENIYADSVNAPFLYGVTSGDPTPTEVIIWTRIESDQIENVEWQISKFADFSIIEQNGFFETAYFRDWTVKVDVNSLLPSTTYYYRFKSDDGQYSVTGRTRTAPIGNLYEARIAVMSCSSIYSGFFNAYKRISEREDLDLIIHVGDYIYDFVDPDEEVRVPNPYPIDPVTLEQWRERHRYYLLDPDLREARRLHPWIALWDNHDIDWAIGAESAPIQAYLEYLPIRLPVASDSNRIFRKLAYGDLIDIFVTDVLMYKGLDTIDSTNPSMIGNEQFNWLTNQLSNSTAKWKLVPMQNLMAGWSVQNVPSFVGIGTNGVLDPSNWDGFDTDRDRVLNYIKNNNIDNVVVLSGDSHVTLVADLSTDPQNSTVYNGNTGEGSIAVEFLPTSITRGNFDEMGFGWAIGIVTPIMAAENPNHIRANFTEHGYGLLDVKSDSCVAEIWYSDKITITNQENFAGGFVVKDRANHWNRTPTSTPTDPKDWQNLQVKTTDISLFQLFPNPVLKELTIKGVSVQTAKNFKIFSNEGKEVKNPIVLSSDQDKIIIQMPTISPGNYFITFDHNSGKISIPFVKQ